MHEFYNERHGTPQLPAHDRIRRTEMRFLTLVIVVLLAFPVAAQQPDSAITTPAAWSQTQEKDALRGTVYSKYALAGRFLTPPRKTSSESPIPLIILQCIPERHSVGYHVFKNGRFLDGYLVVGAVLNSQVRETGGTAVVVSYRLDDRKIHQEAWSPSTDISSAFFPQDALNNMLYGHALDHKEGTGTPVHKIVFAVDEYLAGEIVMQFDVPDSTQVSESCGVTIHKN